MQYTKKPLTINEQINKLELRGLNFSNHDKARNYLMNISYYRLRAFTYPFQENNDTAADHSFLKQNIDFNDIIDLYVFDRRLRNLIFNELEKIEISVRTQLSLVYSVRYNDPFWYLNKEYYSQKNENSYHQLMADVKNDVERSNEDFIKHYKNKYSQPAMPPSWMTMEVVSFGTLSRMYNLLKKSPEKRQISRVYGIGDETVFANWLHAFSNLRNCCAHHSRIWNRRFVVHLILPYNTTRPFLQQNTLKSLKQNKIFALLTAIKFIVDIISPENSFKNNLQELLNNHHNLLSPKEMGFPNNWLELPVWNV